MEISFIYLFWAFSLGILSAASLPLGAWIGLITRPRSRLIGFLAAFGAGALLAALSIELVAPSVLALGAEGSDEASQIDVEAFLALVVGAAIGSSCFVILDQIVNAHGGFLRKSATTLAWFTQKKKQRQIGILRDLSSIEILQSVPDAAIQDLVDLVTPVHFNRDEVLFKQGDPGDALFFIRAGEITLYRDGVEFKTLGSGAVLGEMSLLAEDLPRNATAKASKGVQGLVLKRDSFNQLRGEYPEFDQIIRNLSVERIEEMARDNRQRERVEEEWAEQASKALKTGVEIPSPQQLRAAHEEHSGAPMAIWLGILLDGIPESLVIGMGLASLLFVQQSSGLAPEFFDLVPYTLIAGLFLSNFPEAFSSSVGMKKQGMRSSRVFWLWFSLMLITGVGAGLGYLISELMAQSLVIGIQGIAAGAMLTMIAAAMIPEAAHRGGPTASGVGTMLGFLAAISFKLLE